MASTLRQPLFIIGLQKSGTTLLNRLLLEQSEYFFSPFKLEGREFWGDNPPFTPIDKPCGEIYQKHNGVHGHFASANDFDQRHKEILYNRFDKTAINAPILINKNPYNTVRITWLKRMFPGCKIVAMVRNPYANVFSLLKKHIPHENRGLGPINGWWGVKPKGWERLVGRNLISQLAKQWREVNKEIIKHQNQIDLIIEYKNLCNNPGTYLSSISKLYGVNAVFNIPSLNCMDDEYKIGSELLSKNRLYQKSNKLSMVEDRFKNIELRRLSVQNKLEIALHTKLTWHNLKTFNGS